MLPAIANLFNRARPWVAQRCIAIDLGSHHVKVIMAERMLGRTQIVHQEIIDLPGEGLLSAGEINQHLQEVMARLGNYPVALVIPQHAAISQIIDLPTSEEKDVQALIAQETLSLTGLSDSSIIYDYYRLQPYGKYRNPIWVTIARERAVHEQINRFAGTDVEICEITTTANALIMSYLAHQPATGRMVLADLGATSTTVAILDQGQCVFATSFPIGGESFTEAVASLRKCSFEEAELFKRTQDLLGEDSELPEFSEVVDIWLKSLEKAIHEWHEDHVDRNATASSVPAILTGGGAAQPGLMRYLAQKSVYTIQPWPRGIAEPDNLPMSRFAVAYGAVLKTFNPAIRSASVLPQNLRTIRRRQQFLVRLSLVSLGLLALLSLLLVGGISHKLWLILRKETLVAEAELALKKAQAIDVFNQQRDQEFAHILPVLERQQNTVQVLRTLQILQTIREPKDLWFVLLADQTSYFAGTTTPPGMETPKTNAVDKSSATNGPPAAPAHGFIVELCIPDKGGEKLKPLNDLVADLKKQPLFRRVDTLPPNQRTNLVDPKAVLPDRYFCLAIELAETGFRRSITPVKKGAPSPPAAAALPP